MAVKKSLAVAITARLHDQNLAERELQQFEQVFSKGQVPDDIESVTWQAVSDGEDSVQILALLGNSGKFPSRKEAKRMLQQGAIRVNGEKVGPELMVEKPETEIIVQAGKRLFFKVLG